MSKKQINYLKLKLLDTKVFTRYKNICTKYIYKSIYIQDYWLNLLQFIYDSRFSHKFLFRLFNDDVYETLWNPLIIV